jgi:tripartite-type tricarboxylate transporter receptor subunit TctC
VASDLLDQARADSEGPPETWSPQMRRVRAAGGIVVLAVASLLFGVSAFFLVPALLVPVPAHAQAQAQIHDWPQRPVTIVVPFAAGGSADFLARILQHHMQAHFGVPFVVENRSGAGGSIGTAYVAKALNDGDTLLLGTLSGNVLNTFLYSKLPYDAERDFQPVSLLVHLPNLLVVNNAVPARTVPELIAYLKANEGKVSYGSSGNGTSSHLSSVMFQLASGTKMTHVPFRSTADVLNSLIGGHIELAIDSMTTLWQQAQAGAIRPLAVTSAKRVAAAPDLPTIGETLNGFSVSGWQGLFAPAGTPRPIVDKLAAEVKRIFELPEVVSALKNVGGEPATMTPDQFADFIRSERPKWREVVKASGVQIN